LRQNLYLFLWSGYNLIRGISEMQYWPELNENISWWPRIWSRCYHLGAGASSWGQLATYVDKIRSARAWPNNPGLWKSLNSVQRNEAKRINFWVRSLS
jgi:hypothetical protein